MRRIPILLCLTLAFSSHAQDGGNALTIYSSAGAGAVPAESYRYGGNGQGVPGYATVRHERNLDLRSGVSTVRVTDVAELIDPTTVSFESLTDPTHTRVLEQNFQFDLVSNEKLLQKFVDQEIRVEQVRGDKVETFTGVLLSTQGGLTLRRADGSVDLIPHNASVLLPNLPGGLITRPTLVWDIAAEQAATHRARISYQTAGITWWADYNVTYVERGARCSVGAWVSILNQSGAGYPDARLKLVAGDVHRAPVASGRAEIRVLGKAQVAMADQAFQEKSFFEYHLYTLTRASTLPNNSTKQIELFPAARGVPCERTLLYYGLDNNGFGYAASPLVDRDLGIPSHRKVDVYLSWKNSAGQGMGMPLPAGRVRVSQQDDADGTLEFVGEDRIDHTPKDETVRLKLGSAFDVVGERKQMDFKIDTKRNWMSEDIEVRLRNHKKDQVTVLVKENLYRWTNWKITNKSHAYDKQDARTVVFPLTVAADGETVLRYSVTYTW